MTDDWLKRHLQAEDIRKTLEAARDPLGAEIRALGLNATQMKHHLEISSVVDREVAALNRKAREDVERLGGVDFLSSFAKETAATANAAREIGLADLQDHYARAVAEYRQIAISFDYDRPHASLIADMARIATTVTPSAVTEMEAQVRAAVLRDQMTTLSGSWVLADWPELSAAAFGRVSLGAEIMLDAKPFSDSEAIATQAFFGEPLEADVWDRTDVDLPARDQARVDAGAEPGLLVLPAGARLEVGATVGLVVPPPVALTIRPLSGAATGFSPLASDWLRAVEIKLRFFVVAVLERQFGAAWSDQLPPDLAEQWKAVRDKQIKAGRPEYALFHYAHFGDWMKVIFRHWTLFAPVFGKKAYIETTFDHLVPLRNDEGHHRPTDDLDELTAVSFSRRIDTAIDAYVIANGWVPLGDQA